MPKHLRLSQAIKPNQGESNQIKPFFSQLGAFGAAADPSTGNFPCFSFQ
jgi:hypothetical protein